MTVEGRLRGDARGRLRHASIAPIAPARGSDLGEARFGYAGQPARRKIPAAAVPLDERGARGRGQVGPGTAGKALEEEGGGGGGARRPCMAAAGSAAAIRPSCSSRHRAAREAGQGEGFGAVRAPPRELARLLPDEPRRDGLVGDDVRGEAALALIGEAQGIDRSGHGPAGAEVARERRGIVRHLPGPWQLLAVRHGRDGPHGAGSAAPRPGAARPLVDGEAPGRRRSVAGVATAARWSKGSSSSPAARRTGSRNAPSLAGRMRGKVTRVRLVSGPAPRTLTGSASRQSWRASCASRMRAAGRERRRPAKVGRGGRGGQDLAPDDQQARPDGPGRDGAARAWPGW